MVNRVFLAGALTLIVFLSGFSVGALWDSFRREKLQTSLDELSVYSTSLFIESQLMDEANCEAFQPILVGALEDLGDALDEYIDYTEASSFDIDRHDLIYRKYLLSNIRYWMFVEEYRRTCSWNVSTVLYFFDGECEGECDAMSTRLDYLKRKYDNRIFIFPVNMELAEGDPVAETLLHLYNVTSYPTLAIDGNVTGAMPLEQLEALVCQRMKC